MLSDISYYVVLLDLCTVLQLKVKSEKIRKFNRVIQQLRGQEEGVGVSEMSMVGYLSKVDT